LLPNADGDEAVKPQGNACAIGHSISRGAASKFSSSGGFDLAARAAAQRQVLGESSALFLGLHQLVKSVRQFQSVQVQLESAPGDPRIPWFQARPAPPATPG